MTIMNTDRAQDRVTEARHDDAATEPSSNGAPTPTGNDGDAPRKKRRRRRRRGRGQGEGARAEGQTTESQTAESEAASSDEADDSSETETSPQGERSGATEGDSAEGAPRKRRRRRRRGKRAGADGQPAGEAGSADVDAEAPVEEARRTPPARPVLVDEPSDDADSEVEAKAEARPEPKPTSKKPDSKKAPAEALSGKQASAIDPEAAKEIFSQVAAFADLGLSEAALRGVADAGFKQPTVIQAKLIPAALTGRDILGQAKTGTGKTASFVLPLLSMVEKGKPFQALILAPTRELAIQIDAEIKELGAHTGIRSVPIYGGQSINAQATKLEKGPEIIVGAPGRVMDMQRRGYIDFSKIGFVVLDEVDRMLDIGFREDIRWILSRCPKKRQTMFVSATISDDIEKLARSYMTDPEKIVTAAGSLTVSIVTQRHLTVQSWDKKRLLAHLLTHEEPALTLVFCRLKRTVDELARYLSTKGIEAHAMHGDLPQSKRNSVMKAFRGGDLKVILASDLASRGIDVEGISHVINYDLPEDIELYIHRIGRTARAGRGGIAWSLVTPEQGQLLTDIELRINAEIPKMEYPDFEPGPVPADAAARIEADKRRVEELRSQNRFRPMSGVPDVKEAADENKFPGGVVPTKAPPRTLGGRVRARRR